MDFQEVDRHIEQVVKMSAFLAKLKGNDDKVIQMLEQKYEQDVANIDSTVATCFYQWFLADDKLDLADTNSVFKVTFDVVNKLEDTLAERPDYWILWILKYKIISFMNFNENELMDNLRKLIEKQDNDEKRPYYLVTEVLLAHVCYTKDSVDEARNILEGILEKYVDKINVLSNFFKGYVSEFKNIVLRSGDDDILVLLEKIINVYF